MPYIGNELAAQFQAFETQTITGDGSTGYTLDRAVANGKELLVYINNVKQEEGSGKSYTASGTTITFSEAVASTDSCYVVYMGLAMGTVTAPDGSIVSAQLANANLEMPNTLDMNGNELILDADADTSITSDTDDQIDFKTGGSDRLIIEADGDVKIGTTSDPSHGTADNHVLAISGKQNNGSGVLAFIDTAGNSDALLTGDNGTLTVNVDSSNATSSSSLQIRVDNSEKMRIDDSGNVIIGSTTSPTGASDNLVISNTNWDAVNDTSDTNVVGILISPSGRLFSQIDGNATGVESHLVNNIHSSGATCSLIQYRTLNSEEGSLTGNSSGLTINNVSDYRKKERITDLTGSIDVIKTLKPRQYYYRKEFGKPTRAYAGFIAHEVQDSLLPHMTNGVKDGVVTKENKENDEHHDMEVGDPVYQTVAYGDNELITRLVGAVQELSAKVETLEAELAKLKG